MPKLLKNKPSPPGASDIPPPGFSVRRAFAGKQIMLIGVTGFIGKVWLANTLLDLPEVKRIQRASYAEHPLDERIVNRRSGRHVLCNRGS